VNWDNGGPIDTLYENAPDGLKCKNKDCSGLVLAPSSTCHRGDELSGNVYCACCGSDYDVSDELFEYAEKLEAAFQEGGF